MNIYLVSRTDNVDYDEYDAFVVVANDENEAKELLNNTYRGDSVYSAWPSGQNKTVDLIGTTDLYSKPTEILGRFNAG